MLISRDIMPFGLLALATAAALVAMADRSPGPGSSAALRWGANALRAGNIAAGVRALEYAAGHGHKVALWKLGRMFADGEGVPQDQKRAFRYFLAVAASPVTEKRGTATAGLVANAFVSLGAFYLGAVPNAPIRPDLNRARELFAYAASRFGDREAEYHLGRLYLDGVGTPRDPRIAAHWLTLAADKGQYQARALLGDMLFKGVDIPRSPELGLMWLTLARDSATVKEDWIGELQRTALQQASDDERALAFQLLEQWLRSEP